MVDAEFGPGLTGLLAFQSVVGEMIERRWFGRYIASLTVEESHSKEEECGDPEQSQSRKTPVCIEHTVKTRLKLSIKKGSAELVPRA